MRLGVLLQIFLIGAFIHEGLACGRKRRHKKRGRGRGRLLHPVSEEVVDKYLGPVAISPYAPSGDSPQSCDGLNCNFEDSCCWNNAVPPADQLQWVKGSGQADQAKLKKHFGTNDGPAGTFLVTASQEAGTPDQTAQFYSCPIQCAGSDVTVKVKHWTTRTMKLDVCTETDPNGPAANCQPLSGASGSTDSVTVPKGENQRIVIKASGYTDPGGSLAAISNLEVKCDPCQGSSQGPTNEPQTKRTAETAAPPTAGPTHVCKDLNCNFEGGLCKYQSGGSATANFAHKQAPHHNRLTGVPKEKPAQGSSFAGSYMKANQGEKTTMAANTNFDKDYTIQYQYFMDTEGITLKGCCDSENSCTVAAKPEVETKDYQTWQTGSFSCPTGTKKVIFVADNAKGANEGSANVDDVKVLNAGGGGPAC